MNNNFYSIARETHYDRVKQERIERNNVFKIAQKEYYLFCFDHRIEEGNTDYSAINFKKYLQRTGRQLQPNIKHILLTKYFGYEAEYDAVNAKWNYFKKSQ